MLKDSGKKETISDKLNRLGLKATPQRLAVCSYLEGNTSHPSVEEIYQHLKYLYPTISIVTVYSTLKALAKMGEIQKINIDPERKRFDPNPLPHSHFLCSKCGRVHDVAYHLPAIAMPLELGDFLADSFAINFYGVCPHCRKSYKEN